MRPPRHSIHSTVYWLDDPTPGVVLAIDQLYDSYLYQVAFEGHAPPHFHYTEDGLHARPTRMWASDY